jgi:hypothetical protein
MAPPRREIFLILLMSPVVVPHIHHQIDLLIPAWARDEPPSPTEKIGSTTQPTESCGISDTSPLQSNRLPSSDGGHSFYAQDKNHHLVFYLIP